MISSGLGTTSIHTSSIHIVCSDPDRESRAPMTQPASPARPAAQSLYKAFAASLSGTSLEWYDFAVYSVGRRIGLR